MFKLPPTRIVRRKIEAVAAACAILFSLVGADRAVAGDQLTGDLALPSERSTAVELLRARIDDLGRSFDGDIGIAVQDIQTGDLAQFDGRTFFRNRASASSGLH